MAYDIDISISNIYIRDMLELSSFHSATGSCRLGSLLAPSVPGCQGLLCTTLRHCYALLLSRPHRQAPQTRFAPPKLPQPLVQLVDVASLLALRVSCIYQSMWEPAAPVLMELVWDCQSTVEWSVDTTSQLWCLPLQWRGDLPRGSTQSRGEPW